MGSGETAFNPYAAPETRDGAIEPGSDDGPADLRASYRVEYRLEGADIAALLALRRRAQGKRRSGRPSALWVGRAFLGVGILLLLVLVASGPVEVHGLIYGVLGISSLVLLLRVVLPFGERRAARKVKERPRQAVEITPSGLSITFEDGSADRRSWNWIGEVDADAAVIVLYVAEAGSDDPRAHIIPRRAFPTPEHADEFRRATLRWWREAPPVADDRSPTSSDPGSEGLRVRYEMTDEELRVVRRERRSMFSHVRRTASAVAWTAVVTTVLGSGLVLRNSSILPVERLPTLQRLLGWGGPTAGAVGGILLVVAFCFWTRTFRLWRLVLRGPRPGPRAKDPVTIAISPAGVASRSAGKEAFTPWPRFLEVVGDERFVKLTLEPQLRPQATGGVILIPRRAFRTAEEADVFARRARQWHAEARGLPVPG